MTFKIDLSPKLLLKNQPAIIQEKNYLLLLKPLQLYFRQKFSSAVVQR